MFTPKTFDGHNINDGISYTATLPAWPRFPATETVSLPRSSALPAAGATNYLAAHFALLIAITNPSQAAALRRQLSKWFNPVGKVSKPLVVTDRDGGNERYIMVRCLSLVPVDGSGQMHFVAQMLVDGLGDLDGRFRSTTQDTEEWVVTASGQTLVVNNEGEDRAFPVFAITPTGPKTTGFAYKRWIPIRWNVDVHAQNLPLLIEMDMDSLISAGKLQNDAADLRFYNNGSEIPRWLKFTDGAWVNLNFGPKQEATLEVAIADTGEVSVIDVNEDISGFPFSGVLMINGEAFTYTNKVTHLRRFTGVSRAQNGTSAAAHTVGDTVWWVQNDLWVLYGDPTLDEPGYDGATEPIFDYTGSDNESWAYTNFGASDFSQNVPRTIDRPGRWKHKYVGHNVHMYNTFRNEPPPTVLWGVVGIHCPSRAAGQISLPIGRWALSHPCGIVDYEVIDGEKRTTNVQYWNRTAALSAKVQSSWDGVTWHDEEIIAAPSVADTWEDWTASGPLIYPARHLGLYLGHDPGEGWLDISVITVKPDPTKLPTITIGDEVENYPLAATITNNTTGESIAVNLQMEVNQTLIIDTDAKTLTLKDTGQNVFHALVIDMHNVRRDWLPLVPGENELQFDDADTANVTINVTWERRFYS